MAEGKTNPQIAAALGVTRQAIWKWSTRPDLLAEVERMQAGLLKLSGAKLTAIYLDFCTFVSRCLGQIRDELAFGGGG